MTVGSMTLDLKLDFKRIFLFLLTIFVCLTLELVLRKIFGLWAHIPNFLSILIIFLAFYNRSIAALLLATAIGLLADFVTAALLGPQIIVAVIVYILFSKIAANLFLNSRLVVFATNAAAALIFILILKLIYYLMLDQALALTWLSLLAEAMITGLVSLPVFFLLSKIFLVKRSI